MLFTEFRFFLFMILVFVVYWSITNNNARKLFLLICSYIFYSAWDWRFLSLIIISTLIHFIAGQKIYAEKDKTIRKIWLLSSVAASLIILAFFKYFNFFVDSLNSLFGLIGAEILIKNMGIILPIGISFYTFHTLTYTIDIYNGVLKPQKKFFDVALFVTFFPLLVAGPIIRAKDFLPQLSEIRVFRSVNVKYFIALFICGLFKKAVIADHIAPIADQFFSSPESYSLLSSYVIIISYAVQIYCDFSGYSDIAIACAGLLGYELCENFSHPYFSKNIREFWRRWHISLSTWFRDYCYIPLGGKNPKKLITYKNLLITMLLCGLWHGASWNFVFWGGYHGIGLILHRQWYHLTSNMKLLNKLIAPLAPLVTFYYVCIGWIFFRANDTHSCFAILKSVIFFNSSGQATIENNIIFIGILLPLIHLLSYKKLGKNLFNRLPGWSAAIILGASFYITIMFSQFTYPPFIYFQF
jgi:alginate O-acetyltransferase complex protein AlgI